MTEEQRDRIARDPLVCHGQAVIKGTRIMVSAVRECLAAGMTEREIIDDYPTLTVEGILVLRIDDQSAAAVIEALGALATSTDLSDLSGCVAIQDFIQEIRRYRPSQADTRRTTETRKTC